MGKEEVAKMEEDSEMERLPEKSKVLRARSIRKRLETERNKSLESPPPSVAPSRAAKIARTPRQHAAMSRYRRKTANAKERDRMRHVNDAFERLKEALPARAMAALHPEAKGTKVDTLRWAIGYIDSLQKLLDDSESGRLDPALYGGDLQDDSVEGDEAEREGVSSKKKGSKSKKGRKRKKKANVKTKTKRLQQSSNKPKISMAKRTPQYRKHGTKIKNPLPSHSLIAIKSAAVIVDPRSQQLIVAPGSASVIRVSGVASPPLATVPTPPPSSISEKSLRGGEIVSKGDLPFWGSSIHPPPPELCQLKPVPLSPTSPPPLSTTPSALASPSGSSESSSSSSSYPDSNMSVGSVSPGRGFDNIVPYTQQQQQQQQQKIFHQVQQQHPFSHKPPMLPAQNQDHQQAFHHHHQHQHHPWYGGILDDIEAVLKQDENFEDILVPTTTQQSSAV